MENFELFEELLKQKPYESLSQQEKARVGVRFSEEEYNLARAILLQSSETNSEFIAEDREEQLITAFREKHQRKKNTSIWSWLNFQIPIWQPTLAFSVFLLWFFGNQPQTEIKEIAKEKVVLVYDTIFIDNPSLIANQGSKAKSIVSVQSKPKKKVNSKKSTNKKLIHEEPVNQPEKFAFQKEKKGRNANEEADLMDLIVTTY